eukprot:916760-Pyramimonas_sp.AAC.1
MSEPVFALRGMLLLAPVGSLYGSSVRIDRALHVRTDGFAIQVKATWEQILEHARNVLKRLVDLLGPLGFAPAERRMAVTCARMSVAKRVCRALK